MPFFESALHLGQAQVGLILSVQMIGSVAMTSVAGVLTDRFGDRTVVFWSGAVMGGSLMAASIIQSLTWLIAWLLVYGIGFAAVTPAGCHAIIFFFKKADRGLAMGVRQCGVPVAGIVGSLLLPAIATHAQYRGALASAGALTLISCSIASSLYCEPRALQGEKVAMREMMLEMLHIARERRLILLTITSMILICGQFALMGFLTLTFVRAAHYSLALAVLLFTLSQLGAVAGRLAWGWISDRLFAGSRTLPLGLVCMFVALVAVGVAGVGPATPSWLAAALSIALGFTAEGWLGLSVIGFAEIGGEEHSGSALGVGLTGTLLAAGLTPALFGALAEAHGFAVAWRWLALLQAIGLLPALLAGSAATRIFRREPLS